jgi:2-polyprenyl-6-methoxyphenol hydroxylase-like FAD-dependent oxidoreductase
VSPFLIVPRLERDLEAARYEAHRAWKQDDGADPENRLVADELERRWDQALRRVTLIFPASYAQLRKTHPHRFWIPLIMLSIFVTSDPDFPEISPILHLCAGRRLPESMSC